MVPLTHTWYRCVGHCCGAFTNGLQFCHIRYISPGGVTQVDHESAQLSRLEAVVVASPKLPGHPGPHRTCYKDPGTQMNGEREADPPRWSAQVVPLPLHISLWVVPYAGRTPPVLVGSALCWAQPSESCGGQGPVAKSPAKRPAAVRSSRSFTAPTGHHRSYYRDSDEWRKGSGPPTVVGTRGSSPPSLKLVGRVLCRAEPSEFRAGHMLVAKPPAKGPAAMGCGGSLTAPAGIHKAMEKGEPTPHGGRHKWFLSPLTEACG